MLANAGVSSEGWPEEGCTSKLTHRTVGSIQYLLVCWRAGLSSLLAVGWRLPSVPSHGGLSKEQLSVWWLASSDVGNTKAMRESST